MLQAENENAESICFLCSCPLDMSGKIENFGKKDETDNPLVLVCINCAKKVIGRKKVENSETD